MSATVSPPTTTASAAITSASDEHFTQTQLELPKPKNIFKHLQYEHLVAGMSGGLISTLVLHPLDLMKIRFAVDDGKTITTPRHTSIFGGIRLIYKQEGLRGLYRGVTPNLIGSGSSWGLYFLFYNTLKSYVRKQDENLGPTLHILCASQAGVLTLLLTNPIWLIKTRLCLQSTDGGTGNLYKLPEYKVYHSMSDAIRKIYISEGLRGFYRGLIPGLFGVSHGAVQFMTYEELKNYYNEKYKDNRNEKLDVLEYLVFAAVSKTIAVSVTYPYQVLRARIQSQHQRYTSIFDCIRRTWRYEGVVGFYKGLGTNLIRVTPATMITFVIYEKVSQYLMKNH